MIAQEKAKAWGKFPFLILYTNFGGEIGSAVMPELMTIQNVIVFWKIQELNPPDVINVSNVVV